jgi:drug/metabolite transporter (DMT)-like permease
MAAILALLSSLSWGTADFLGGLAARRVGTVRVLAASYPAGALLITAVAAFLIPGQFSTRALLTGAAAGTVGLLAIGLLYAALARGQMGVVSPITAVLSGAVPVVVGLSLGESIGLLAGFGIVIAGTAVIMVSRESGPHRRTPAHAVAMAVGSGLAIGVYLSILGTAPIDSGIWVAAIGRWVSTALILVALAVVLLRGRESGSASDVRYPWNLALAAGGLDALANAIFQLAAQRGSLAIVAVIGSLYPAATVVLARYLLHERLSGVQNSGVVLALIAAAILAIG